jgi:hypothetical protein
MGYFPRIVISCPPSIIASWRPTPIGDLFDSGNLTIRIQPQTYTRIEEGEKSRFNDFFCGVGYQQSPQRIGFSVAVADVRDELAIALSELSRLGLGNQYVDFTPIDVLDYCRLDDSADYARGYAVRRGQIWVENLTGTITAGRIECSEGRGVTITELPTQGRYNNGFSLKFLSLNKQVIG